MKQAKGNVGGKEVLRYPHRATGKNLDNFSKKKKNLVVFTIHAAVFFGLADNFKDMEMKLCFFELPYC